MARFLLSGSFAQVVASLQTVVVNPYTGPNLFMLPVNCNLVKLDCWARVDNVAGTFSRPVPSLMVSLSLGGTSLKKSLSLQNLLAGVVDQRDIITVFGTNSYPCQRDYLPGDVLLRSNVAYAFQIDASDPAIVLNETVTVWWEITLDDSADNSAMVSLD